MKKTIILIMFIIMIIGINTTGCKKKAPPPKPTPMPTSTPVPKLEKIVYTFNGNMYWMEPDGTAREELFADGKSKWFPSVSPDGWYVAYWVQEDGAYNLWMADFKNKRTEQITFDAVSLEGDIQRFAINNAVAWTPDSEYIIYSRHKDIWKITRDGYNPQALTDTRNCISPDLAADNSMVYVRMESDDTYNLYIKNAYSSNETKLTNFRNKQAGSPAFSNDGSEIYFTVADGETVNLYKMNVKDRIDNPVSNDGRSFSPVYTHNGNKILFSSFLDDKYQPEIWIMNRDGSDRRKLTKDGGVSPSYLFRILQEAIPTPTPVPEKPAEKKSASEIFDDEEVPDDAAPAPTADMGSDYTEEDLIVKTVQQGDKLLFYPVIQFDTGVANIKSEFYGVLDDMTKLLAKYQSQIVIEGHTDNQPIETARFPSNKELSVARAEAVKNYLVNKKGVSAARIKLIGYGESRPLLPNTSPENMYKNRRAEIYVKVEKVVPSPTPKVVAPASTPTPIAAKKGSIKKIEDVKGKEPKKDTKTGGW